MPPLKPTCAPDVHGDDRIATVHERGLQLQVHKVNRAAATQQPQRPPQLGRPHVPARAHAGALTQIKVDRLCLLLT